MEQSAGEMGDASVVKGRGIATDSSGQAIVEYLLLLSVIVTVFVLFTRGLASIGLGEKMMRPINDEFRYAYRYGHPKARGYDDGGPKKHPRAQDGEDSFRMFYRRGP